MQDKILIVKSLSITSYIHIVIHKVVHESLILENSAGEVGWLKTSLSWSSHGYDVNVEKASWVVDGYGFLHGLILFFSWALKGARVHQLYPKFYR